MKIIIDRVDGKTSEFKGQDLDALTAAIGDFKFAKTVSIMNVMIATAHIVSITTEDE